MYVHEKNSSFWLNANVKRWYSLFKWLDFELKVLSSSKLYYEREYSNQLSEMNPIKCSDEMTTMKRRRINKVNLMPVEWLQGPESLAQLKMIYVLI